MIELTNQPYEEYKTIMCPNTEFFLVRIFLYFPYFPYFLKNCTILTEPYYDDLINSNLNIWKMFVKVTHEICNEIRYHIEARIILLTQTKSKNWPGQYPDVQIRPSVNVSNVSGENDIEVLNEIELIQLCSQFFKISGSIPVLLRQNHLVHCYIFQWI